MNIAIKQIGTKYYITRNGVPVRKVWSNRGGFTKSSADIMFLRYGGVVENPNEIRYTTSDGNIIDDLVISQFDKTILSHTYGHIVFDGEILEMGEAFRNCSTLRNVILPSSVDILYGTFQYSGVSSITLSPNLRAIGASTFNGAENLTSITIPASILEIGSEAFYDCSSLHEVVINATTPPDPASDMFGSCASDLVIKVPAESLETYKSIWSMYADKIVSI